MAPLAELEKNVDKELMKLYNNPTVEAIFDVSGGDLANEVIKLY